MTRRPPDAGTVNGSDTSCSPSTVASARTSAPAGRSGNSARPCVVGRARFAACPLTVRRTSWPATLLPIASRTTRTVTVPLGSSGAGMARPWISDGSGMLICAEARSPRPKAQGPSPKAQSPKPEAQAASHRRRLQLRAAVLAEPRVGVVGRAARRHMLATSRGEPCRARRRPGTGFASAQASDASAISFSISSR